MKARIKVKDRVRLINEEEHAKKGIMSVLHINGNYATCISFEKATMGKSGTYLLSDLRRTVKQDSPNLVKSSEDK